MHERQDYYLIVLMIGARYGGEKIGRESNDIRCMDSKAQRVWDRSCTNLTTLMQLLFKKNKMKHRKR